MLKEWFENLGLEEKENYYNDVSKLEEILKTKISRDLQVEVEHKTNLMGGTTLVCAIIGKDNTIIANIGDSRAYIINKGKLEQLSREDTVAEDNLQRGKAPSKEASRFDKESHRLLQCIGMSRKYLQYPHIQTIDNKDYDVILLFSDGVTDCLSDDDIAVVCKNSNRKEVAKELVKKALRHDSIAPEEYQDYEDLTFYIPGGKDNTTAAVYAPKKDENKER